MIGPAEFQELLQRARDTNGAVCVSFDEEGIGLTVAGFHGRGSGAHARAETFEDVSRTVLASVEAHEGESIAA